MKEADYSGVSLLRASHERFKDCYTAQRGKEIASPHAKPTKGETGYGRDYASTEPIVIRRAVATCSTRRLLGEGFTSCNETIIPLCETHLHLQWLDVSKPAGSGVYPAGWSSRALSELGHRAFTAATKPATPSASAGIVCSGGGSLCRSAFLKSCSLA